MWIQFFGSFAQSSTIYPSSTSMVVILPKVESSMEDPISGREVKVRLGRFGPLAQIGNVGDDQKPVFASLTSNQTLENISFTI